VVPLLSVMALSVHICGENDPTHSAIESRVMVYTPDCEEARSLAVQA